MLLLPREHSAYGQMAFPVVTSFAVAGVTIPALLLAVAVVAGFLVHEPLLVLLGRRGVRAKREQWHGAAVWLGVTTATTLGVGLSGWWLSPRSAQWSLLLPLVPAVFLSTTIKARREKSSPGEVAVALAFSLVAVPLCLAAGATTNTAFAVAIPFALIFVVGTLAVRVIVLGARGGGDPRAAHSTRLTVLTLITASCIGLVAAASRTLVPWTTLLAAIPGVAGASWIAVFPPSPTRLRTVGWTLVTTSAAAALILIVGFAGAP